MLRTLLRRGLRHGRDVILGADEPDLMTQMIRHDPRSRMYRIALEYANTEKIPGDILEFGVFTGISLCILAGHNAERLLGIERKVVGFDSFEGLPALSEPHAWWKEGEFAVNGWWHPLLRDGEKVTPERVRELFRACGVPEPILEVGSFRDTIAKAIPSRYPRIAILHIDSDLYESAKTVLEGAAPALEDGCLILFDEWFAYRGDPNKGEARAFREFLAAHPEWEAIPYKTYGVFCNSFILHRR